MTANYRLCLFMNLNTRSCVTFYVLDLTQKFLFGGGGWNSNYFKEVLEINPAICNFWRWTTLSVAKKYITRIFMVHPFKFTRLSKKQSAQTIICFVSRPIYDILFCFHFERCGAARWQTRRAKIVWVCIHSLRRSLIVWRVVSSVSRGGGGGEWGAERQIRTVEKTR